MRMNLALSKVGILALTLILLSGCSIIEETLGTNQPEDSAVPKIKMVKVERIVKQKIEDPVEVIGEVFSSVQMKVNAETGGEIAEILKQRGDTVKQGDVLVRLSSTDLQLQRDTALATLNDIKEGLNRTNQDSRDATSRANQNVNEAQKTLNKLKNDYDLGLVTDAQLSEAQVALKNAQIERSTLIQQQKLLISDANKQVRDAELAVKEADQALKDLVVKATVSGILTESRVYAGMSVAAGEEIGTIENVDKVNIKANLNAEAAKFAQGKKEISYYTADEEIHGRAKVSFLSTVIDPESKAYELSLEVPNLDRTLKPGLKVRMQLTDENEQFAVAVPSQSIVQEGDQPYVFVLKGEDTVEKRRLELGRINEPFQEVLSGIVENDWLVISGQRQLIDLEKVQVQKVEKK